MSNFSVSLIFESGCPNMNVGIDVFGVVSGHRDLIGMVVARGLYVLLSSGLSKE